MAQYNRPDTINTGPDTTYINANAIERLEAELLMADAATPGTLPGNAGSVLRWIVDQNLGAATDRFNALVGRTDPDDDIGFADRAPADSQGTYAPAYVEKRMNWWGEYVPVRLVDLENMPKGEMDRLSDAVGYAGAETLNGLIAAQMDGRGAAYDPAQPARSTNQQVSVAGAGGDDDTLGADDFMSAEDFYLAAKNLRINNVKPFADNGYYRGFVHPTCVTHLQTEESGAGGKVTWAETNKYVSGMTGQEKLLKGESGSIAGIMIMETTDIAAATVDTVAGLINIVLGKDAVGLGSMSGAGRPEVKVHRSGTNTMSDPFELFGTVAWRVRTAPVRIQEASDADVRGLVLISASGA